ncbi:hypothetical protein R1sor_012137 [Riccia sorocarpa]|uniref:Uncharacterized protein n=1 Tax=Riccia sorocarpa TaxID=122646 RepID=A0ABD3I3T2_9MARC
MPGDTSIETFLLLCESQGWIAAPHMTLIRRTLRKEQVNNIESWADWAERRDKGRPLTQAEEISVDFGLQIFVGSRTLQQQDWKWEVGRHKIPLTKITTQRKRSGGTCGILLLNLPCEIPEARTLLSTFDKCFQGQNPASSFLLAVNLKVIWQERNELTYSAKRSRVPIPILLSRAKEMLEATRRKYVGESKELRFAEAITAIQNAIDRAVNTGDRLLAADPLSSGSLQQNSDGDNSRAMSDSGTDSNDLDSSRLREHRNPQLHSPWSSPNNELSTPTSCLTGV